MDALKKALFEPLKDVDLKFLMFKTVFLFALASDRRRSEIHALDFASVKLLKKNGYSFFTAKPFIGFLAKNLKTTSASISEVTIPSLKELSRFRYIRNI